MKIRCLKCNDVIAAVYSREFKKKDGKIIYQVENSKLVKLIAPEWTIVEIRDKIEL